MPRPNSTNKSENKKHNYSGLHKNHKRVIAGLRKRMKEEDIEEEVKK